MLELCFALLRKRLKLPKTAKQRRFRSFRHIHNIAFKSSNKRKEEHLIHNNWLSLLNKPIFFYKRLIRW